MKYSQPDENGMFGEYGGRFVPIPLEKVLREVESVYFKLRQDPAFIQELDLLYQNYVNRPSRLYFAKKLSEKVGGGKIYLKREDLNHTGAHKINNTIGQALVARKLGKKKLIAETGAGQHGVAVATVAARFGMACDIYMGERDIVNQSMNVYRMKLLGARVVPVNRGQRTLKDAIDMALEAFVKEPTCFYMLGSAVGPHPYPTMVRDFQAIIGLEAKEQILHTAGKLPDYVIACIGGGSNAIGLFFHFIKDESVKLIGIEPAGQGQNTNRHGLSLMKGKPGMIHGFKCLVLQNNDGAIAESYSAASGLDYPGVGPELSYLKDIGRIQVVGITDKEATKAFQILSKVEGIIPALESAHAISYAIKLARQLKPEQLIIVNLSGRGDKDVENVMNNLL